MRKLYILLILLSFCCFLACKKKDVEPTPKEIEEKEFTLLLKQLTDLSLSQNCGNEADWKFVAYGSKACGGPVGFIAYSTKIDTVNFLKLINEFSNKQNEFNTKWQIKSTCEIIIAPKKVICENGKPKFEF